MTTSTIDANELLIDYTESLRLLRQVNRLMLGVMQTQLEHEGIMEISATQAVLLYTLGESEMTSGELRDRGFYQGSDVSHNLKKLIDTGYLKHRRCETNRRTVMLSLTDKGLNIFAIVGELYRNQLVAITSRGMTTPDEIERLKRTLEGLEQFWSDYPS